MFQRAYEAKPVVLVVEDEPILRLEMADLVEEIGLGCVGTSYAFDAVCVLEQRADIALVITDVLISGSMDGWQLVSVLRRRWPPIPFIVISARGWAEAETMPRCSAFVAKPYSGERIKNTIRSLLETSRRGPREQPSVEAKHVD